MIGVTHCLWFDSQAEEAARQYVAGFDRRQLIAGEDAVEVADEPVRRERQRHDRSIEARRRTRQPLANLGRGVHAAFRNPDEIVLDETVTDARSVNAEQGDKRDRDRGDSLARLLWRPRHDRSGANRLKFAWKILRLRQVGLSDERILENFRTFSVGRPVGYP